MRRCHSAHRKNLLTHWILNSLPDSKMFKQQRDFIASYLSDIGRRKGGTAKANLNHIKNGLIYIEADQRSKGQPTSQTISSANNRRTFNTEDNGEERCQICNRSGQQTIDCKSPCWHCKKPGHCTRDCTNIKRDRGRSQQGARADSNHHLETAINKQNLEKTHQQIIKKREKK